MRNAITDVPGLRVGQAQHETMQTGVTVVLPDRPAPAVVDHRGGGIGSRGSSVLALGSSVTAVHGIALSGGSAYGLDATGGVMHALRQQGVGFAIAGEVVPIVAQSIIFDLVAGGKTDWEHPPWWALGAEATAHAGLDVAEGNVGAGRGATAGRLKGGVGTASMRVDDVTVGALAVANPVGEVVIPGTRTFWGWMHERDGELGGQTPPNRAHTPTAPATGSALENTTLVIVATDAILPRDALFRLAVMAQDGLATAIRPAHGPLDGDTVYALSTEHVAVEASPALVGRLGAAAADTVARAIMRAVYAAEAIPGYPAYRDLT